MLNSDPLKHINEKHKIRVPRPQWQACLILGTLVLLLCFAIITTSLVSRAIVGGLAQRFYPALDHQGTVLHKEYPMSWSREKAYGVKNIKLLGGVFQFNTGEAKQHYYFIMKLKDGIKIKTEVTKELYERIGFFDGLCVEYKKGRFSDSYYVSNIYPAQENNLKARFWHVLKN